MEEPGNWDRLDPSLQNIFIDNSRTMLLWASSPPPTTFSCEQLGLVAVPVTITVGRETRPTVSMVAEAAQGCISNSQLVEIPDALLWAPANNAPAFNETLLNHLENPAYAWSANAMHHRGENGQRFSYDCPANGTTAGLWGTDTYTDDSSVCTAAVHAGLITVEQGGPVTIEILPGQKSYRGSDRNGVTSDSYVHWFGSYSFVQ